jgi:hypothetical protein
MNRKQAGMCRTVLMEAIAMNPGTTGGGGHLSWGALVLGGTCPRGAYVLGGICPGGTCPRGHMSGGGGAFDRAPT